MIAPPEMPTMSDVTALEVGGLLVLLLALRVVRDVLVLGRSRRLHLDGLDERGGPRGLRIAAGAPRARVVARAREAVRSNMGFPPNRLFGGSCNHGAGTTYVRLARTCDPSARLLREQSLELVRYEAHQAVLDSSQRRSPIVGEVELARDGVREKLARVADLRQVDAGVSGERAQCAEVTARGREALLRAIEVEQIDHELDLRFEALAARDLLQVTEVRRQLGMIEVRRQLAATPRHRRTR